MNTEIEKYEKILKKMELSDATIRSYVYIAKRFEEFRKQRNIDKELVIEYKQKMLNDSFAIATVNLHIVGVNKYIKVCGIVDCEVKSIKVQRRQSLENVITRDEYKRLLEYALESGYKKYYYIMKTLALTGIRVSELKYITVRVLEKGYTHVSNKGKIREIYLPESLTKGLKRYCKEENISTGVVFRGKKEEAISREAVWKMLKQFADLLGIDRNKVYPHSFRHYFALSYMERYSNLFELADILGHSNLETTRIYASTSIQCKRDKMEQLDIF